MKITVGAWWLTTLVSFRAAKSQCDFAADDCDFQYNGVCNEGPANCTVGETDCVCAVGTDCGDCASPCGQHRFTSCETCTGEGAADCVWCATDALCLPSGVPLPDGVECSIGDLLATCPATNSNPFPDPLFDAMDWIYNMINVKPVWASGITGTGVYVRVNDDGVDNTHPEFAASFDSASSCPVVQPITLDSENSHGTTCAAIAVGGGNSVCSTGIALNARLSGCSMLRDEADNTPELQAYVDDYRHLYDASISNLDVSSNSYGVDGCRKLRDINNNRRLQATCPFMPSAAGSPCLATSACAGADWSEGSTLSEACQEDVINYCDENYEMDVQGCIAYLDLFVECTYIAQDDFEREALAAGVTSGRGGRGIVYVYASGNEFDAGADNSQEGTMTSRFTIAVGAVGKDGRRASYSTPGAALLLSAPGGDDESFTNNVVAGAGGGCRGAGIGTSFATPVVTGVVALMLEANSNLGWRDVQGIFATTSQRMDSTNPSWMTNAAGLHHSNLYGFGVVDANAAVTAARTWVNYGNEQQLLGESGTIDLAIADYPNDAVSSTVSITASSSFMTESVSVYLSITHSTRGDLDITLVSPSGTETLLHPGQRPEFTQIPADESWKLMTVRYWNEPANGQWTLRLIDRSAGDFNPSTTATPDVLRSWRLMVYGHSTEVPSTSPTSAPTSAPTAAPTSAPTAAPTSAPSPSPTAVPPPATTACSSNIFLLLLQVIFGWNLGWLFGFSFCAF